MKLLPGTIRRPYFDTRWMRYPRVAWTGESTTTLRSQVNSIPAEINDSESPGPIVNRIDELRLALFCATMVGCAIAYSSHLTSFLHAKEYALAVGGAVLGTLTILRGRISQTGILFLLPLVSMAVVAALSGLTGFTDVKPTTAIELLRWSLLGLVLVCTFDLLENEQLRRIVTGGVVVSAVAVSALALAQFAGIVPVLFPVYGGPAHPLYSVFGNPGLMGGYVALALPLAVFYVAKDRRFTAFWTMAAAMLGAGLALSGTRSAWAAAVAGTLFVVVYWKLWNRHVVLCAALLAVAIGGVAWYAPGQTVDRIESVAQGIDASSGLRLWFWSGAVEIFRTHPVFGTGPGSFAFHSPLALAQVLHNPAGAHLAHNEIHTLHAHNDALEFAADVGVVGVGFILWWWLRLLRCSGPEWGGLVAYLVFACFYFPSFSTPHALVLLVLAGMLFARRNSPAGARSRRATAWSRMGALVAGLTVVAASGLVVWMVLVPSYAFRSAQDVHLAGGNPIPPYERLSHHLWAPVELPEKLGLAYLQAGMNQEAEEQFQVALDGLDTGSVYLGLGIARLQQGKREEARAAFEACVFRWPSHAFAWSLLLRTTPESKRMEVMERARQWLSTESMKHLEEET